MFYFWSSGARFSFPFHYKDFFDTDSNVLVKNGSKNKVSQGLVFPRDVHVPGFEFIYLGPRAEEERMPSFFPFLRPLTFPLSRENRTPDRRFVDPQLRSSTLHKSSRLQNIFDRFYCYFVSLKVPWGVLLSNGLMVMCRWMGSHFYGWIDYNGVAFLLESLEWDRTFSGFGRSENSGG